jgi:hypothetical protein
MKIWIQMLISEKEPIPESQETLTKAVARESGTEVAERPAKIMICVARDKLSPVVRCARTGSGYLQSRVPKASCAIAVPASARR